MKKLLIMLSIMGASQALILNAGDECKAEARGISLTNDTGLFLYAGVYGADNNLCFDIIEIGAGQRIPDSGTRSLRIPKTGIFASAKMYFSDKKSDIKRSLTKDDIKNLENKKFMGFKVSSNDDYRIYPINSKGKPDKKSRTSFEGDKDSSSLQDKLFNSLRN